MNVLAVISPGLRVLFERAGKPEVVNRPDFLRFDGTGAVIACNHVGWAYSLWMAYAVYPRQLRYMSKQELFGSTLSPTQSARAFQFNFQQNLYQASSDRTEPASGEGKARAFSRCAAHPQPVPSMRRRDRACRD